MATTITSDCINCGACEPECPNNAISQGEEIYVIDPQLCTECVGFHDYEACAAVCPVDCCVPDPNNVETEEVLIARARALHQEVDFGENFESRFRKGAEKPAPVSAPAKKTEPPPASPPKESPAPAKAAPAQVAPTPTPAPPTATIARPEPPPASPPKESPAPAKAAPAPPPTPSTGAIDGEKISLLRLPEMEAWEIPVRCFQCGQAHREPARHFKIGNVLWCPQCHRSMVVKDNLNFRIRTTLKEFYQRWEKEQAEFQAKRERELRQFQERRGKELKNFEDHQQRELAKVKLQLEEISESYDAPGRPRKKGSLFAWA